MLPHRLRVKYFLEDPSAPPFDAIVPVFHRWIQQRRVEELLIDVANYRHVHEGPGIVLIGHEADYALDHGGRPGLAYTRKRDLTAGAGDDLAAALHLALGQALNACHLLATEPELAGRVAFRTDEVEITFFDLLRHPNTAATAGRLAPVIRAVAAERYGREPARLERVHDDPRFHLTLRLAFPDAPPLAALRDRLPLSSETP
ncbi:hypothetical protein GQ464_004605 [Rhodocaloribacter litoris]|uniref:hypothetical protein n=1 Tax=Rhodocaloribacter litoris TaxID=2558931 RepID=UPI0014237D6C|nr:hypothetical protein [Rhodocaloribacter litoris]QXD16239.1 hypothetical protein GQ464_004605 [Rhodocaloribacter litoris]